MSKIKFLLKSNFTHKKMLEKKIIKNKKNNFVICVQYFTDFIFKKRDPFVILIRLCMFFNSQNVTHYKK